MNLGGGVQTLPCIHVFFSVSLLCRYQIEENPWNRCNSKGFTSYPLRESNSRCQIESLVS